MNPRIQSVPSAEKHAESLKSNHHHQHREWNNQTEAEVGPSENHTIRIYRARFYESVFQYQTNLKNFVNNIWINESKKRIEIFRVNDHKYIMVLNPGIPPQTILILGSDVIRNQLGIEFTADMKNGVTKYFLAANIHKDPLIFENFKVKYNVSFVEF